MQKNKRLLFKTSLHCGEFTIMWIKYHDNLKVDTSAKVALSTAYGLVYLNNYFTARTLTMTNPLLWERWLALTVTTDYHLLTFTN